MRQLPYGKYKPNYLETTRPSCQETHSINTPVWFSQLHQQDRPVPGRRMHGQRAWLQGAGVLCHQDPSYPTLQTTLRTLGMRLGQGDRACSMPQVSRTACPGVPACSHTGTWQISDEPRMTITATVFLAMCLPDAEHREPFVPEALLPQVKLPTATREVIRFPFSSPPHLFTATMLRVRIYINCPLICGRKSKIQFGNPQQVDK